MKALWFWIRWNRISSNEERKALLRRGSQFNPRAPGLIVVCFGRFWVRGLPFPNARHLGTHFSGRTHFHGT